MGQVKGILSERDLPFGKSSKKTNKVARCWQLGGRMGKGASGMSSSLQMLLLRSVQHNLNTLGHSFTLVIFSTLCVCMCVCVCVERFTALLIVVMCGGS